MKWVHYSVGLVRRREGFTVLRLLVTLAIVAMLLGAAFPNIASVTRIYSVRSAARQVYSELQNARMSAVMANQSYTFTINGGGTTYTVSPGTATALEAAGITMSAANAITFASNGTASASATVTVSNSFGDTMQVAVGPGGRVRIQ